MRHVDDGVLGGLGPRSGRGGERDEGQGLGVERFAKADDLEIVHHTAARPCKPGCRLAQIDDRTAADRHDSINAVLAAERHRVFDHIEIGLLGAGE